jgi:hypothetical protein
MSDDLFNGNISIEEALAKLRVRLLNLTSRNRLLNFKHSPGKSLQFLPCSPHHIYQRLLIAQNGQVPILPVPEPGRGDWVTIGERLARPDAKEHARNLGLLTTSDATNTATHHDLQTLYYQDALESRCRKLARESESAIAESGKGNQESLQSALDPLSERYSPDTSMEGLDDSERRCI